MSKLGCPCGNVIRDNTDSLPWKFHTISEQSWDLMFQRVGFVLSKVVGDHAAAVRDFGALEEQLGDAMHSLLSEYASDGYTCTSCGRVHLQQDKRNLFKSFVPEDPP